MKRGHQIPIKYPSNTHQIPIKYKLRKGKELMVVLACGHSYMLPEGFKITIEAADCRLCMANYALSQACCKIASL